MRRPLSAALLMCQLPFSPAAVADEFASQAATSAASAQKKYLAHQFFETDNITLPPTGGISYSADGEMVLFGSDRGGKPALYSLSLDSREVRPIAIDLDESLVPLSYFPHDERVLFGADRQGNELIHIYVREADGSVRDLTPGGNVRAEFLGWSSDRKTIHILSNARDPRAADLYAVDARSYRQRLLLRAEKYEIVAVSPDGRWAALEDLRGSADSNLYIADLTRGSAPRLITLHEGRALHHSLGFSPDSSALLYATDAYGEFAQGWRYDLATGKSSPEVTGNWDISLLRFSPSLRYRVSAFNTNGRTALTIFDQLKKQIVELRDLPSGEIGSVRFDSKEKNILFTLASDRSPADIYAASLVDGTTRQFTRSLGRAMAETDLVEGEDVRIRAPDGIEIPSIVYRPKTASASNPVPAVVWVHGGPDQSRHGWSPTIQHLVNNGYAVIAPNFRGSLGYGKTFFHLDDRKHGVADLDDVVEAGRWARAQAWIDNRRVAVMGRSYGGFLTAAALALRPGEFDAGIDLFGVTNWTRTLSSIPPWWESLRAALYEEMGDPATDAERHRAISPLFHADRIREPLLVVQGANDPRVLKAESDELVAAVRANAIPVEYLLFDDEGHGFRNRENLVRAQEAYVDFLGRYLQP